MPSVNRLAPPLRNSLAESVPVPLEPGMRLPEPVSRFVPRRELENLSIGLGRGQVAAMEGTWQLLTQPVPTAQALIEAARQIGADPRIILDMLRAARQKAMSGSLGLGELVGENLTPGFRSRGVPNVRKIFVGKSSKTWDAAAAKQAEKLEAAGESPERIWQQTGTFRSPDGQLRQEVSDLNATWIAAGTSGPASEMLKHAELYSAYPDVAQIPFKVVERKDRGGQYSPAVAGIQAEKIEVDPAIAQTAAIHELQHAIQHREGFSKGGMPFSSSVGEDYRKGIDLVNDFSEKMDKFRELRRNLPSEQRLRIGSTLGWHTRDFDIDELFDEIEDKVTDPVVQKQMLDIIEELDVKRENAFGFSQGVIEQEAMRKNYMRIAGEAEARAAQARAGMTPAQRRLNFPLQSYDVPINQLIERK